jgi:hypothetical protein
MTMGDNLIGDNIAPQVSIQARGRLTNEENRLAVKDRMLAMVDIMDSISHEYVDIDVT